MLEVELPYPPSINHYWRRVGRTTLISREGRIVHRKVGAMESAEYEKLVQTALKPPPHAS